MQRKRSTEEEESATAVQREMKEKKTEEMRQALFRCVFFNCGVHPWIPPAECYCDLVSCSEKSMMGERSPLSGSPLILCISSSFPFVFIVSLGAGLCVVE